MMSDDDDQITETITAEFRDGQLQIVEMSPGTNCDGMENEQDEAILPDEGPSTSTHSDQVKRFVEVVDPNGKGVMRLDLVNLTFIRCGPGGEEQGEYQLVESDDIVDGSELEEDAVTCVLETSDQAVTEQQLESYVVVNDQDSSLMFLQPEAETNTPQINENTPVIIKNEKLIEKAKVTEKKSVHEKNYLKHIEAAVVASAKNKKKPLSDELVNKLKLLKKLKAEIAAPPSQKRGRKRLDEVTKPQELLASPTFKLYLYSCKLCGFKCNAVKELTAHKSKIHGVGSKYKSCRLPTPAMQCARCPYRAATQPQLMKHAREKHLIEILLNKDAKSPEVVDNSSDTNVLVCGGCGFESSSKIAFKTHIEEIHMKND